MLSNTFYYFFFVIICLVTASCVPQSEKWEEIGLAPIYISPSDFSFIKTESPRASEDQGSQVEENGYIYINERVQGIHVFDNSDPSKPSRIYFWKIPGNTEFQIANDRLYADNSRHLITIDISDASDIKVLSHVADVYTVNMENVNYPRNYSGRFECPEFEEGIVVDWESKLLDSPRCYIW